MTRIDFQATLNANPEMMLRHPSERELSADEQRIVEFIQHGIDGCVASIKDAALHGAYGAAGDQQTRLLTLVAVRDSLINGYHDKDHPVRVLDPKDQARTHLACTHIG